MFLAGLILGLLLGAGGVMAWADVSIFHQPVSREAKGILIIAAVIGIALLIVWLGG